MVYIPQLRRALLGSLALLRTYLVLALTPLARGRPSVRIEGMIVRASFSTDRYHCEGFSYVPTFYYLEAIADLPSYKRLIETLHPAKVSLGKLNEVLRNLQYEHKVPTRMQP